MITELTAEQWEGVHKMRAEWLAAGLSTEPADRPAAEAAITRMYEMIGKRAPQFVWCDSVAAALMAVCRPSGEGGLSLRSSLGSSLGSSLKSSVGSSMWSSPESSVESSLESSVGSSLWSSLGSSVESSMWSSLGSSVGSSLPSSLRSSLPSFLGASMGAQTGAHWIAFYEVPRRLGIVTFPAETSQRLDLWVALARSCGWWWPYENICVVTERPAEVHTEPWDRELGTVRLHRPDGPAMVFRDGWAVHAWHGTNVPADLIEEGWDVKRIFAERNAEVRRCAIEILGWDEMERHLPQIAQCPDPGNPGQFLALCDIPDELGDLYDAPARVLLCTNGTPEPDGSRRRFGLPVPAHHTDPVAAAAELYGWPVAAYRKLARRA